MFESSNTSARIVENATGRTIGHITAEDAWNKRKPESGTSWRCEGKVPDPDDDSNKVQCDAEMTPYYVNVKKGPSRYYFRVYENHDDGEGFGLVGHDGHRYRGHRMFCIFSDPGIKVSTEFYTDLSQTSSNALGDILNSLVKTKPAKVKTMTKDSDEESVKETSGESPGEDSDEPEAKELVARSAVASTAKELWCTCYKNNCDPSLKDVVMTDKNISAFRRSASICSGPKVFLACSATKKFFNPSLLIKNIPELKGDDYVVLEDAFIFDENLQDFSDLPITIILKGRTAEGRTTVRGEFFKTFESNRLTRQREFTDAHGPYFAVLCDWDVRTIEEDGRLVAIGEIRDVRKQFNRFKPDDLKYMGDVLKWFIKEDIDD